MSTGICLFGRTYLRGFYLFEGTALRLLARLREHVYEYPCVNGNMPTNWNLFISLSVY